MTTWPWSIHRKQVALSVLLAVASLFSVRSAAAQLTELRTGARVRIRAVAADPIEGTIVARRGDTIVVTLPNATQVTVPLATIVAADVYRQRSRTAGARKGALWGAVVGVGLGAFNVVFSDCAGSHCRTSEHLAGTAAFGAVGAGVGALLGLARGAERWEHLAIPSRTVTPLAPAFVVPDLPISRFSREPRETTLPRR